VFVEQLVKFEFVDRKTVSAYFPLAIMDTFRH
jgi:hypothetical protein